jgi:hypothetical protein
MAAKVKAKAGHHKQHVHPAKMRHTTQQMGMATPPTMKLPPAALRA